LQGGPIFDPALIARATRYFDLDEIRRSQHILGIDIGWGHGFACAWLAWSPEMQRYWVYDCFQMKETTVGDFARRIHATTQGLKILVAHPHDTSHHNLVDGRATAQLLKDEGLNMMLTHVTNKGGRADRLARALAAKTGPPVGWTWLISHNSKTGLPSTFRTPPAPYRERTYGLGPGFCRICGQPVYKLGWHRDLWNAGPNKNAVWHCACVSAWQFWNAPNGEAALLRRLQGRRCGQTGGRLWKDADVDHRVPLFRV
jgi:hypothetical protein